MSGSMISLILIRISSVLTFQGSIKTKEWESPLFNKITGMQKNYHQNSIFSVKKQAMFVIPVFAQGSDAVFTLYWNNYSLSVTS